MIAATMPPKRITYPLYPKYRSRKPTAKPEIERIKKIKPLNISGSESLRYSSSFLNQVNSGILKNILILAII